MVGAKQFVVQDAQETILSDLLIFFSLTPNTTVFTPPFLAGADKTTFLLLLKYDHSMILCYEIHLYTLELNLPLAFSKVNPLAP